MNSENGDDSEMDSWSRHFNLDETGDPEAQEYIQRIYEEQLGGQKWLRIGAVLLILGETTFWWLFTDLISADALVRSVVISFFPFGLLVIPFMVWAEWHIRSYRKDARYGEVKSISGSYEKPLMKTSSSSGRPIKIKGEKVLIPLSDWKSLPDEGTITAEYFPHTRLCWRLDGRKVRETR